MIYFHISGWNIFQFHYGDGRKQCRSNSSCAQHSLQVFFFFNYSTIFIKTNLDD